MLYTSNKVYEFPYSTKTRYKTCGWSVGVPSNEWRYQWAASRSMMIWVSSSSLRRVMYSILRVSSFCREKVESYRIFSELIMHIMRQLFEYKRLSVINTILELQFTNHSWENYFELPQRNGTYPSIELFNSPRGITNLYGVYGCRGNEF